MSLYSQQRLTLAKIIQIALGDLFSSWKQIVIFLLIMVIVKDGIIILKTMTLSNAMIYFFDASLALIELFFLAACFLRIDARYRDVKFNIRDTFRNTWKRTPNIFATFFLMILIITGVFYLGFFLVHIFKEVGMESGIYQVIYIALPILILFILMQFAIPLSVIEERGSFDTILTSIKLIGIRYFHRAFILYALILLLTFTLLPHTQHAQYFMKHHLIVPFDFLIFSLLGTFLVNFSLLLLNDLKIRVRS